MEEEKNKNEECPLCQVSQETLGRLKGESNKGKSRKEKPVKKKKGLLSKIWGK